MILRESLRKSIAAHLDRAEAISGSRSVSLSTLSFPLGGGQSGITLVVAVPGDAKAIAGHAYKVLHCRRDAIDAARQDVLNSAGRVVGALGGATV